MIVLLIEVVLAVKLCLILTKYCYSLFVSNSTYDLYSIRNTTSTVAFEQNQTLKIIHVLVFIFIAVIDLLNMLEYLQLGWGTWKYFHDMEQHPPDSSASSTFSHKCKCVCTIAGIGLILFLIPVGKFAVGVVMEVKISGYTKENSLIGLSARIYIVYCVFEFFNASLFACPS